MDNAACKTSTLMRGVRLFALSRAIIKIVQRLRRQVAGCRACREDQLMSAWAVRLWAVCGRVARLSIACDWRFGAAEFGSVRGHRRRPLRPVGARVAWVRGVAARIEGFPLSVGASDGGWTYDHPRAIDRP